MYAKYANAVFDLILGERWCIIGLFRIRRVGFSAYQGRTPVIMAGVSTVYLRDIIALFFVEASVPFHPCV